MPTTHWQGVPTSHWQGVSTTHWQCVPYVFLRRAVTCLALGPGPARSGPGRRAIDPDILSGSMDGFVCRFDFAHVGFGVWVLGSRV